LDVYQTLGRKKMQVTMRKWGNSIGVRIPAVILTELNLSAEKKVDVRAEAGRIIIEPIIDSQETLEQLLGQITPDNVHSEIDFGQPVGKELL
jgi:antitoxin MazE